MSKSDTATLDLSRDWFRLDQRAAADVSAAFRAFQQAVRNGDDWTQAWLRYRVAVRARWLLADRARTAVSHDEQLVQRISVPGFGRENVSEALADVIEQVAAERADEELDRWLG